MRPVCELLEQVYHKSCPFLVTKLAVWLVEIFTVVFSLIAIGYSLELLIFS